MNIKDKNRFQKFIENFEIDDYKKLHFYGFTKTGLYEIIRQR